MLNTPYSSGVRSTVITGKIKKGIILFIIPPIVKIDAFFNRLKTLVSK